MTNDLTDNLFSLIKSLSPSEKRQFSLFVGRIGVNADSKFLHLFKMISKQKVYDEEAILRSTNISKQQLSNIKGHLYRQILISLRLNPSQQNVSLWVREQLDFALILYRKGLYKQSLKILDKAKQVHCSTRRRTSHLKSWSGRKLSNPSILHAVLNPGLKA